MKKAKLFTAWIENPIKTWWKARKYFKFPHVACKVFRDKYSAPYMCLDNVGKILNITIRDVGWKEKWYTPRHETNPVIWITFFRQFHFMVTFTIPVLDDVCHVVDRSMEYWEYLLDYLYYTKTLKPNECWQYDSRLFQMTTYSSQGDKKKPYPILIQPQLFSLNKRGQKEFNRLYDKRTTRESTDTDQGD